MSKRPKVDLSVYLVKSGEDGSTAAIKDLSSLTKYELDLGRGRNAVLLVRRPRANPPKWAKFFSAHLAPGAAGRNSSTGAVFSVTVKNRTFLLSFGQGWHSIDASKIDSEFGLKTALNILDPHSIRSIDKASLEAQPRQLREQSGRATEIQYFGIDIERDLLRAVTGKPRDDRFGMRVSGLDSLRLSVEIEVGGLPDLLVLLLSAYESNEYKKGPFAWVDHIGQVRDPELKADLDRELVERINRRDAEQMWLSVPEIIDWNRVVGFKYSLAQTAPRVHDVRVAEFVATFDDKPIEYTDLIRRKIYCVDADDNSVLDRPAYTYFYAEMRRGNDIFLLNNASWYRVQRDYARSINDSFDDIPMYNRSLPDYNDETEGDYNSRVAASAPGEYVLFDRDLVRIPAAASSVEVCDLYRDVSEFVHVKRYGGSSVLSHLFNQGLVSGELFQMDPGYRNAVNERLPRGRRLRNAASRPTPGEFKVVYAIISESLGSLSIPFFSKVSLKHCRARLEAIGFKVMISKIAVVNDRKVLKVKRPGRRRH